MKKTFFFLALCLGLNLRDNTVHAQTIDSSLYVKTSVTISQKDPQKVIVTVTNPQAEKLTIEVYSAEHELLLSKTTKVNDYRADMDFSTAIDGTYYLEISCSREKTRKTIWIGTKDPDFSETRKAFLK